MAIMLKQIRIPLDPLSSIWEFELPDGSVLHVVHDLKGKPPQLVLRSLDIVYYEDTDDKA